MNARRFFHTATIAKYQKMYIITMHSYPFAELVGRNTTRKVRLTLKNNSFVYIPVDKLAELIQTKCPPNMYPTDDTCKERDANGCIKCWHSWLKGGDSNG